MYIGLVQSISSKITAFYFKPNSKRLAYDKQAVGINKLNGILPSMCKEAGFKPKSNVRPHYLTQASKRSWKSLHGIASDHVRQLMTYYTT